jgi:S1-C subfamily serine protease
MSKNQLPPPMKASERLKEKLKALLSSLKKSTLSIVSLLLIFGSAGFLVIKAPEIHRTFLRMKVGSKVYMIKAGPDTGGGTGFAVKAASGQSYIVTNSHVCDGVSEMRKDGKVLVADDSGRGMLRGIIEVSDRSDLCIIEGLPGVEGLSLGNMPGLGQEIYAVGHPLLNPLSIAQGEVTGRSDVKIFDHLMHSEDEAVNEMLGASDKKCDLPKNEIVEQEVDLLFFKAKLKLCLVVTKGAYSTAMRVYPGNSGSPAVDSLGRVIGVVFATQQMTYFGSVVSLEDLQELLSQY